MAALANQSHLAMQDLESLNLEEVNPLTPEIISRQATQNIGTIGHVAHGKSTLVLAVSGVSVSNDTLVFITFFWPKHTIFIYHQNSTVCLFQLLTYSLQFTRPFAIKKKRFVTSQLNWVMPMPNSTSVLNAPILSATSPTGQSKKIKRFANTVKPSCFFGVMFPLSIARVTTFLWLPCLQVLQSWTVLFYSSQATSRVRSRRPVNTWLQYRSWTLIKS